MESTVQFNRGELPSDDLVRDWKYISHEDRDKKFLMTLAIKSQPQRSQADFRLHSTALALHVDEVP
jgi:hypothetical protein